MYNFTEFLEECMKDASVIAMSYFGKVGVTVKPEDNNQVLTAADLAVGTFLVEKSRRAFPEFNIIDEETGVIDNGSPYTIVIDPIDGTSNFANGLPHFGIFMGILNGGVPVAGVIALPAFGDVYVAEKGKGAFRNSEPIRVSDGIELKNALVAYGIDGHQENPLLTRDEVATLGDIILAVRNVRTSNSAFDFAAVADGRYGLVMNHTSKIWDNVAPHSIIEEAGGIYTDFYGNTMDYADGLLQVNRNYTVCAGAPALHANMQQVIHTKDS